MNKKIFLPFFIIVFILGCGAQSTPNGENLEAMSGLSSADSPTLLPNVLPTTVDIPVPKLLLPHVQDFLLKIDLEEIDKTSNQLKEQLNNIEPIMPQLLNECANKSSCYFPKNHFKMGLGAIEFLNLIEANSSEQQLTLDINSSAEFSIKWNEGQDKVESNYKSNKYDLSLKYQIDEKSETLLVSNQALEKRSDYFIQKVLSTYFLDSNYINKNSFNFSTHIKIEDNIIEDQNKNLFTFDSLNTKLSNGSYVILPPINLKDFTLKELMQIKIGMITVYNGELQGFLDSEALFQSLDELKIILIP